MMKVPASLSVAETTKAEPRAGTRPRGPGAGREGREPGPGRREGAGDGLILVRSLGPPRRPDAFPGSFGVKLEILAEGMLRPSSVASVRSHLRGACELSPIT
jgi:hypothetical protein